jgi:hypothetical protein
VTGATAQTGAVERVLALLDEIEQALAEVRALAYEMKEPPHDE